MSQRICSLHLRLTVASSSLLKECWLKLKRRQLRATFWTPLGWFQLSLPEPMTFEDYINVESDLATEEIVCINHSAFCILYFSRGMTEVMCQSIFIRIILRLFHRRHRCCCCCYCCCCCCCCCCHFRFVYLLSDETYAKWEH